MIRIEETVLTPKPRNEVFAYVADFSTTAEWDPGIRTAVRTAGDGGVGTTYDLEATFMGRTVPVIYEVLESVENERFVIKGENDSFIGLDTITFHDRDGATEIVYVAEFTMKGVLRFAELLLRPVFNALGKKAVGGLDNVLNG
ncbi:MAG TPA: SRPBCC family protein [Acidimicrobiia bacterium]|nr:SRPBCC family protein [Acidimicrobiia bacterium]